LEIRKDSIRNLTAKTQQDYFEKQDLSEITYKTRITKYAELIRDINRQIPLLNEKLELKLKKKKDSWKNLFSRSIFSKEKRGGHNEKRNQKESNKKY